MIRISNKIMVVGSKAKEEVGRGDPKLKTHTPEYFT